MIGRADENGRENVVVTDEFIREVDEEYRRDRIAQIWKRHGNLIVGLAVLLVAVIGGWRLWQHFELQRAQAAAIRFENAVTLAREAKTDEAVKSFEQLAADGPGGYRLLARFRVAAETGGSDPEAGAKAFDALAADSGLEGSMRDLARIRAASLRLATGEAGAGQNELERIAAPTSPWRHTAREILGLAALKRGDLDAAGRWFDQIAADRETPQNLRGRLEVYSALVAGGPVATTQ